MPPDMNREKNRFSRLRLPYRVVIIAAVFLSVLMFSCSKEDKPQPKLDEKITDTQPIVSPIISSNENITKGNDFFLKGEFNNAIEFYSEALAQNRSIAFYNMGVSYYLLGDIDKAEDAFRQAVQENPNFKEAYMNLGVVLMQTGKLEEAEKIVRRLLKDNNASTAKMLVNMANIHLKRGETALAAEYFQEAMKKGEHSKYVQSNYAYFLMTIGEYKDGIAILENLQYKDYTDYYNLASAYYNEGMYQQGLANALKAMELYRTEEAVNLAALNYAALGDNKSTVTLLKELIEKNPLEEYRFRLAKAHYLDGQYKDANKEITALINEFPDKTEYYRLKYEILLGMGEIADAGNLATASYERFKTDDMLYMVVKHRIIYYEDISSVEPELLSDRSSPFLNLARVAYYIYKDKMVPARRFIENIPPETDNDYYIYQAYINLKYKKYDNVLTYAKRISKSRPEYFWYRAAVYFNTNNVEGLKETVAEQMKRSDAFSRATNVKFHLIPRMEDIDFSYRFDGKYEQMLSLMLYPLFIEPSEMMNFVAMGYKLLQDNNKLSALRELERSVEFSEGIKMNNAGVADMFAYRFKEAFEKFNKANDMLNNNPYTLYNMGLAKMNLGEPDLASKYFDTAVLQNNYHFPAYLGLAATMRLLAKTTTPADYYNIVRDRAIQSVESKRNLPEPILYSSFLADTGLGMYKKVKSDLEPYKNKNTYFSNIYAIADYMSGSGHKSLAPLNNRRSIYRGRVLWDLTATDEGLNTSVDMGLINDRAYKFMKSYALLKRGKKPAVFNFTDYKDDKAALKEMVYYSIMLKDKANALKYLQQMSAIDIRYKELYKASLYYFLWIEDFVNAEASYTSLANLRASDRYTDYYKLMYFVLNYNSRRLMDNVSEYMKNYPQEMTGKEVRMVYALRSENFEMTLNTINDIEKQKKNFLSDLPLEISIDGL
ncbi:tetratricopeptide repeat protein [Seleniivibrio sp.]|uniref:tetratricopeptide repeat protein n=1 Tax=Seleniivibrio sp. TaxID=2898801 RepID=UPI0025F0D390|nr:tetratricopeptide repeat protein [Seleniivibrio sp.]MCD8554679.1 tetratricopeptide repeat protein [Seleniivibrio sp.]